MTPEVCQAMSYISLATGLVAVLALYWASLGVPFEMQSYKGKTPPEVGHKRRQQALKWIGLPCVFVSFGCQFAIVYLTP